MALGRPALFEEADAQELRDLADSRNRTRGERTRNKRLKRCWAAVERARAVALSSSGAELAAAVDRVPERESLDGCAAGHSSWLGWHAPPALDLAQCGPIARQSARLMPFVVWQVSGRANLDRRADRPRLRGR